MTSDDDFTTYTVGSIGALDPPRTVSVGSNANHNFAMGNGKIVYMLPGAYKNSYDEYVYRLISYVSTDGGLTYTSHWLTSIMTGYDENVSFCGLSFHNGTFYTVARKGDSQYLFISSDGINWTSKLEIDLTSYSGDISIVDIVCCKNFILLAAGGVRFYYVDYNLTTVTYLIGLSGDHINPNYHPRITYDDENYVIGVIDGYGGSRYAVINVNGNSPIVKANCDVSSTGLVTYGSNACINYDETTGMMWIKNGSNSDRYVYHIQYDELMNNTTNDYAPSWIRSNYISGYSDSNSLGILTYSGKIYLYVQSEKYRFVSNDGVTFTRETIGFKDSFSYAQRIIKLEK